MTEVIAGRVDFFLGPMALVVPQIRAGKLMPPAVNTDRRSTAPTDVPTTREAGFRTRNIPSGWPSLRAPHAKSSTA